MGNSLRPTGGHSTAAGRDGSQDAASGENQWTDGR